MNTIKALRKKRGITQMQFAKEAGVSQQCVAKWESGKMPKAEKLPTIAKLLDCSIEEILEG